MKKFTKEITVKAIDEMNDPEGTEIEVTVTNDRRDINDGEFIVVSFFSDALCKEVEKTFDGDEIPSDSEICDFVAEKENCDWCEIA